MRILLVGDYSSVHLELRNYFKDISGIEVILASNGDGFKNYDRDIDLSIKDHKLICLFKKNIILKKILSLLSLIMVYLGIKGIFQYFTISKKLDLKGIDIIQLVNTVPLANLSSIPTYLLIKKLLKNNPKAKLYLLAAGDDYEWATYCLKNKDTTYFKELRAQNFLKFTYTLKYKYGLFFKQLHKYIIKKTHKIIPILYDYYECYRSYDKCVDIIPIGISQNKFTRPSQEIIYPINVFHGWQYNRGIMKGNKYFHAAVLALQKDLGDKYLNYILVQSVPYKEYLKKYKNSHIFLDQCFSLDCGVNAILGMAAGKVVFSGFSQAKLDYCQIFDKSIGVNAMPDYNYIYSELKALILNKEKILEIQENAYQFAKDMYSIDKVAKQYLDAWNN